MDELTGEFVAETREMLEAASAALLAWEAAPSDIGRLDELFRFVHTVKGSCGFLDLPRIAALAHATEAALAAVRDGSRAADSALVVAVLGLIDRIGHLVAALEPGNRFEIPPPDTDADLIGALDRRSTTLSPASARLAPVRSVRVAVPLLEAMMTQVSELVMLRNELARMMRDFDEDDLLRRRFDRLSAMVGDLRESVTQTRMQPIERLFATLPRLVRDTAAACGKSVTLELAGQDVEIDREMVEAIRDPLIHIVRNAIDHGIEDGAVRVAAGKPMRGQLHVAALQSGNQVSIQISDDGRGIDIAALIEKAVTARVIDRATAAHLDPESAAQLIFAPGLSTATTVTEISGRGVGMDVVRANVERLGGKVTLVNRPGKGLTITLCAPLTLSIVTALTMWAGGQRFAVPRGAVEEVVALSGGKMRIDRVGSGMIAVVRDRAMAALDLATQLGMCRSDAAVPAYAVVIATAGGQRYALVVDAIGEPEELVVRSLAPMLAAAGPFAGQSLSDAGQPLVILDPVALAARAGIDRRQTIVEPAVPIVTRPLALFAESIDGRRIAIRADLLERLVDLADANWTSVGRHKFAVVDETLVPAAAGFAGHGGVAALLRRGGSRVVLPLIVVDDLRPLPDLTPVGRGGVEALLRLDGHTVELLDGQALFADVAVPARSRPVAAITLEATSWARSILAPLLDAAGYDVHYGAEVSADLVIALEGDDAPIDGTCVRLERGADGGVAIERYDRARLDALVAGIAA